jgi:hypothetical protein
LTKGLGEVILNDQWLRGSAPIRKPKTYRGATSLIFLSLTLFFGLLFASGGFAQTAEECFMCHGDESLTKEDFTGKEMSLYADESVFAESSRGMEKRRQRLRHKETAVLLSGANLYLCITSYSGAALISFSSYVLNLSFLYGISAMSV